MRLTSQLVVRPAILSDAPRIAAIYSEAILARNATMILDPVTVDQMSQKIQSLHVRESLLVASLPDEPIAGWGIVKFYSERPGYAKACETSLFIDANFRGQGLGTALQIQLIEAARKADFHHILVRIWAQNTSSISLHEKLGFTLVGVQKEIGHVDSKWVDVAIMQYLFDPIR